MSANKILIEFPEIGAAQIETMQLFFGLPCPEALALFAISLLFTTMEEAENGRILGFFHPEKESLKLYDIGEQVKVFLSDDPDDLAPLSNNKHLLN